jgi:hypothetical protein
MGDFLAKESFRSIKNRGIGFLLSIFSYILNFNGRREPFVACMSWYGLLSDGFLKKPSH